MKELLERLFCRSNSKPPPKPQRKWVRNTIVVLSVILLRTLCVPWEVPLVEVGITINVTVPTFNHSQPIITDTYVADDVP